MMNKKIIVSALILLCASAFISCQGKYNLPKQNLIIEKKDGTTVKVNAEIASKFEERNYGFMNRKNIPEGTGMLFVFENDQILSFWMKNTPTPLSIAYIDSKGKIIDIYDMTPYSLSSVTSTRSVRYALEVPQGWYKKTGISTGDKVIIGKPDL